MEWVRSLTQARSIPFEGATAISGQSFPSNGVSQDWTGTIISP